MRSFYAKSDCPIYLGRAGENAATQVIFDISYMIKTFGEGTVSLIAQREGDEAPYPCVTEQSGNRVVWTINDADNAKAGKGSCELRYMVGDTIAKSEVWETIVWESMGTPTEDVPEAYQSWVDQVLEAAKRAEAAAERVEEAVNAGEITDTATGKKYTLQIVNGKLTMSEVTV